MTAFDCSILMAEQAYDIEMHKIFRDLNYQLNLSAMTENANLLFSEAAKKSKKSKKDDDSADTKSDEGKAGKSENVFKRMLNALLEFFRDLKASVASLFERGEHLDDIEKYLQTDTGTTRLSCDIEKMQQEVEKKWYEGKKLIHKISTSTGIPDKTVDGFCKAAIGIGSTFGPVMVYNKALGKIRERSYRNSFVKMEQNIVSANNDLLKDLSDDDIKTMKIKRYHATNTTDEIKAAKAINKKANKYRQKSRIFSAMNKMMNGFGKSCVQVQKEIHAKYQQVANKKGIVGKLQRGVLKARSNVNASVARNRLGANIGYNIRDRVINRNDPNNHGDYERRFKRR